MMYYVNHLNHGNQMSAMRQKTGESGKAQTIARPL